MGNIPISLDENKEALLRRMAKELHIGKKGSISAAVASALEELASLENYVGIGVLKKLFQDAGFKLLEEVHYPVDKVHDTVGLVFHKQ